VLDAKKNEIVGKLEVVAKELGATVGQLALAWVLTNPHVSTVITGSSRIEQLHENLKAADLSKRITPEIKKQIEDLVGDNYE
jgi:aryl-alcohol dehydrogenase-like predicted oxidoreductase